MPSTALLIFLETVLKVISSVCLMEAEGGGGGENEGGRIEKGGGRGGIVHLPSTTSDPHFGSDFITLKPLYCSI